MRKHILALLVAILLPLCACSPAVAADDSHNTGIESLVGTYAFAKQIYMNPASSFLARDGFREYYTLSENALVITDFEGRHRRMEIVYQEAPVDVEAFRESFVLELSDNPDLSAYQSRTQVTMTDTSYPDRFYRLYQLDGELWLAQLFRTDMNGMQTEYFWSIYQIKPFQGSLPLMSTLYGTKDGVNAFLALHTDFVSGYDNDECFNITPDTLRVGSGYSVFKYSQSCAAFLLYEGEIYPMGDWFGGYGVTSMAQADLNRDGLFELYFTYSFGSGLHRSYAACFDPAVSAIVPVEVVNPKSGDAMVFNSGLLNGDMIVAPNQHGSLSLYSATVSSMRSFVEMELESTGLLYDITGPDENTPDMT